MSDFSSAIRSELDQLSRELEEDPRYLKILKLKEVLAVYERDGSAAQSAPQQKSAGVGRFERTAQPKRINRAPSPERENTLRLAAQAIEGRRMPTKTAEIYEIIAPQGAQIGGAEPKSNLSAMLHHSDLFTSHGRQGWTLSKYDVEQAEVVGDSGLGYSDQQLEDYHGL